MLLEDRLRRAVEERDDQTKEAEARKKAKLAALEEEKERATAVTSNLRTKSAKEDAVAAVEIAKAEMISAIARVKSEMEGEYYVPRRAHCPTCKAKVDANCKRRKRKSTHCFREGREIDGRGESERGPD